MIAFLYILIPMFATFISGTITEEWITRYDGYGNSIDQATCIAVDEDSNVYVTGWSVGLDTKPDYATIKYNSDGVEQWVARYNGPGSDRDEACSIAVDEDGNVYVTGWSAGLDTKFDYATIKYNSDGLEQWVARYNGTANDHDIACGIAVDEDGNVYVTGNSIGNGTFSDYATIKYSIDGEELWVARYDGPSEYNDFVGAIAIDRNENVYVTGRSKDDNTGDDYTTIKYNSDGEEQWITRYNGPGVECNYDEAKDIAVDEYGNVYVTGYSWNTSSEFATIKYNINGEEQWVARYGLKGSSSDSGNSIAVDEDGNVFVTGDGVGTSGNCDYTTIKYNSSGIEQWATRYNGPGDFYDIPYSITVDESANVYVTGRSIGIGNDQDCATVKYNTNGVEQWVARYSEPGDGNACGNSITLDGSGNVYVTGYSNSDYVTIKYHQNTGI